MKKEVQYMVVIFNTSLKGGVGKTTYNAVMATYLAEKGLKTLVIDLDPQANLTTMLGMKSSPKSYLNGINQRDLREVIQPIRENLDIIVGHESISELPNVLTLLKQQEKATYLDKFLEPIKADYDYILIDSVPSRSLLLVNVLAMTDYVYALFEASPFGVKSLEDLSNYISVTRNKYDLDVMFLGVIQYGYNKNSRNMNKIVESLEPAMREAMLENVIYKRERASVWANGITLDSYHDKNCYDMFKVTIDEQLDHINE